METTSRQVSAFCSSEDCKGLVAETGGGGGTSEGPLEAGLESTSASFAIASISAAVMRVFFFVLVVDLGMTCATDSSAAADDDSAVADNCAPVINELVSILGGASNNVWPGLSGGSVSGRGNLCNANH